MKEPELLDALAANAGLYISDLRSRPHLLGDALLCVDEQRYPLEEWREAARYLVRGPANFRSAHETKQYLLEITREATNPY